MHISVISFTADTSTAWAPAELETASQLEAWLEFDRLPIREMLDGLSNGMSCN